MSDRFAAETTLKVPESEPRELTEFVKSLAVSAAFILKLAAASAYGGRRCFMEQGAATQFTSGALAESSTQFREMMPEAKAKFESLLSLACNEIIEDGMRNVINERLSALIVKHFDTVVPAVISVIEMRRTPPTVAAEILKELGRLRDAASHAARLWVLEHALKSRSPMIRDGAGLGLARLGDPDSIPYLRQAVESEPDVQTRADLHLVLDEVTEIERNGVPVADRH